MKKYGIWIILTLAVLALAGTAVALFGFWMPYREAVSYMPAHGEFVIEQQENGDLLLSWPEADREDCYYCLEFLIPVEPGQTEPTNEGAEETGPEVVFRDYPTETTNYKLPQLPQGQNLTLRIQAVVDYRTLWQDRTRLSDTAMEITTIFDAPQIMDLNWTADPNSGLVSIHYNIVREGDYCRVYLAGEDGRSELIRTMNGTALGLFFGDQGDLSVPKFHASCTLTFDSYRQEPGMSFYGCQSAQMTVVRDDLLGRELGLKCKDEGHNVFTLTWNETKGEYYEVQMLDSNGQWQALIQIPGDGQRTYTTPHLPIYSQFTYRVVAVGGQTMEDSEFAAVSEEVTVTTRESPIYTTIWPVLDLDAYSDSKMTEKMGNVVTGQAYCVLDEKDGMFGIRLDGEVRYIDSNYCMINLPEYIGDLCRYQITNSDESIYMVHEFEIPEVTGERLTGYEYVKQNDGTYLVPLLYPTAKKLVTAAHSAREQGYCLKIYDAYRPNKTTLKIYDLTEKILDDPLPDEPYTDVDIEDLDLPELPETPAPEEGGETGGEAGDGTGGDGTGETGGEEKEEPKLTYRMVMTNETYGLPNFLARGGSLHNLGIAMDLTIVNLSTGQEMEMQTSMHDLSAYSVLTENNWEADTLAYIMNGAGFGGLTSEWWHFQDNDARYGLALPTVWGGISAEGWMADDTGWRYRTSRGSYIVDETTVIDEVEYTFDEAGYVVEP